MAKSFKDIFAQLAPGGSGQLVMQKRLRPQEPAEDGEGEDEDQPSSSDRYSGVKVKVRALWRAPNAAGLTSCLLPSRTKCWLCEWNRSLSSSNHSHSLAILACYLERILSWKMLFAWSTAL